MAAQSPLKASSSWRAENVDNVDADQGVHLACLRGRPKETFDADCTGSSTNANKLLDEREPRAELASHLGPLRSLRMVAATCCVAGRRTAALCSGRLTVFSHGWAGGGGRRFEARAISDKPEPVRTNRKSYYGSIAL